MQHGEKRANRKHFRFQYRGQGNSVCGVIFSCWEQHITSFTFNGLQLVCAQQAIEWNERKERNLNGEWRSSRKWREWKRFFMSVFGWSDKCFELDCARAFVKIGFLLQQCQTIDGYLSSLALNMGWREVERTKNRMETESHCGFGFLCQALKTLFWRCRSTKTFSSS